MSSSGKQVEKDGLIGLKCIYKAERFIRLKAHLSLRTHLQ